jgi:hypothetical protein
VLQFPDDRVGDFMQAAPSPSDGKRHLMHGHAQSSLAGPGNERQFLRPPHWTFDY